MQDRKPTNIQISYQSVTKDGVAATTIQTENADEMKKVINKLNEYPYSRRFFADSPAKESRHSNAHTLWISLGYWQGNGKPGIYSILIHEDGSMQTADSGEPLRYTGVGRFGTQKTKPFYHDMEDFFGKLEKSSEWKKE